MKKKIFTLNIKIIIQIIVAALYLVGCSVANTVSTPESMPTDIPTMIPTIAITPIPTDTAETEKEKISVDALTPSELEKYNNLTARIKEIQEDPKSWTDPLIGRNTYFIPWDESKYLDGVPFTENQVKAGVVFKDIMNFMCDYGLLPKVEEGELKSMIFYGLPEGVEEERSQALYPELEKCTISTDKLNALSEQGWTVVIGKDQKDSINGTDQRKSIKMAPIHELLKFYEDNKNAIKTGRDFTTFPEEYVVLRSEHSTNIVLGVKPDWNSFANFASRFEDLAKQDSMFNPTALLLDENLDPSSSVMNITSPVNGVVVVLLVPPGEDLLNAYQLIDGVTPDEARAFLFWDLGVFIDVNTVKELLEIK